jgi:Kef-type K+ transport system membrane component KefB
MVARRWLSSRLQEISCTPRKEPFLVNNNAVRKVLGAIVLTVLWILCFLYISPSLVIDFGGGVTISLLLVSIIIGLLIIFFYHQFYHSTAEVNKLSWTTVLTMSWLALVIFFPFRKSDAGGAVGFFALLGGLVICVLWVRFFSDEISLEA